jgi:hypothetical protein
MFMLSINDLVLMIHTNCNETDRRFVITTTGGGYSANKDLMTRPGASNTILALNGPYAREATMKHIQEPVDSFASLEAANELSITSLNDCRFLRSQAKNISEFDCINQCFGIGVAAALKSATWKKGDHRCHIVITSNIIRLNFSLTLHKGSPPSEEHPDGLPFRSREEEDTLCGNIVILLMAHICGLIKTEEELFDQLSKFYINILDKFEMKRDNLDDIPFRFHPIISNLRSERINNILCIPKEDGTFNFVRNAPLNNKDLIILSGSFNPLHAGHISCLNQACLIKGEGCYGIFELCIKNIDKPSISDDEIIRRLDMFRFPNTTPIVLTEAPLFVDKARIFSNASYAIGVDLVIRLVDPKYFDHNYHSMIKNLLKMIFQGAKFYVSPRSYGIARIPVEFPVVLGAGDLLTLDIIMPYIPEILREYFISSKTDYPHLSSTSLRD